MNLPSKLWPGPANPNPPTDRERRIALDLVQLHRAEGRAQHSTTPDWLSAISQALADYRRELTEGPP